MADEIYPGIKERVESEEEFPATGRVVPELIAIGVTEIHELIQPPWRIFYRIYQNEVKILSIIDGRGNIEELPTEK